ncbi:sigma-54 interaction domain-containing protein [Thiovibrio sp. JS02]
MASQGNFLGILNAVPHGMALLDSGLRIVEINRFLEALAGCAGEEVRGIHWDYVVRSNFGKNSAVLKNVLASGIPCCVEGDILGLNRRKTPVRFTATPLAGKEGTGAALVLVLEDMTAFRAIERKKELGPARGILGHSPKMQEILALFPVLAHTDSSLLITGETGTGKDVLAEAIHHASKRGNCPFIKVNCGALPESLLESELFGHVRGAFTGAHADKHGMFQLAQGGTIFLTEIGDLPLPLQVKLLTVLDDREFFPLGSQKKVKVDVRLITGTHRDLGQLVQEGKFREDLFFRLNVLRVHMPPLRERDGDVRLLLDHFLQLISSSINKGPGKISAKALQILCRYHYPGNIRELRNIIEYAVNISRGGVIGPEHLPPQVVVAGKSIAPSVGAERKESGEQGAYPHFRSQVPGNATSWREIEKQKILSALLQAGGSRGGAAKALGWGRTTLWRKIKEYGLE